MTKYEERFHSRYNKKGTNECWEWTAGKITVGYGQMWFNGKMWTAHRIAVLLDGRDPEGYVVRHECDNRKCVNPNHLLLGTHLDNMDDRNKRDRLAKGSSIGIAKLTEADIPTIMYLLSHGVSQTAIAKQFGVSQVTISNIKHGRIWSHVK
jgi:hypothetical protein